MRIFIFLLAISQIELIAQVNPSIQVGMTLAQVKSEIASDNQSSEYIVKHSNNTITVAVKPESQLNKNSIVQYLFEGKVLTRIRWTNHVPNPDGMLNFIYQNHSSNYGDPVVTRIDGNKAYMWRIPEKIGYYYFYKEYVRWFKSECFITLISANKL